MFIYLFNIIISPIRWLWENIIMHRIYGVSILGVFFLLAFTAALFRFIIIPYFGGFTFKVNVPKANLSIRWGGKENNIKLQSGNSNSKQIVSTNSSGNSKVIHL